MSFKTILLVSAVSAACAAQAQTFTGTGVANATVQPAGPRAGTSGTNFFNVEGSANGTNSSLADFGVIDFNASSFGAPTTVSVVSATLNLTESNAAFTLPATLHFYASTNTSVSISNVAGASPLKYQIGGANFGIDPLLATLVDLGTGQFTTTGNPGGNPVDSYGLSLTSGGGSYLASALSSGTGVIRLVVASETANGAATFAGVTNSTAAFRPQLVLTTQPVPEPSAFAAVGLGALGLLRRRRKS